MANRFFIKSQTTFLDASSEQTVVDINIAPNLIKFKLTVNYNQLQQSFNDISGELGHTELPVSTVYYDYELPLDALKSVKRYASNTLYGICLTHGYSKTLNEKSIISLSELTKPLRLENSFSNKLSVGGASQPYLQIMVKDPNGTFVDQDIIVFSGMNSEINSNVEFTEIAQSAYSSVALLDPITVAKDNSYTSDEYVQYTITTQPYVGTVYLEQVHGVINKTRATIGSDGKGSFRVLKSSVDSDNITVRLGFVSYVGLTTFTDTL
jgi:hypothetical protein